MTATYTVLIDGLAGTITLEVKEVNLKYGGSVKDVVITRPTNQIDPIRYCTLRTPWYSSVQLVVELRKDAEFLSYNLKFADKNSRNDFAAKFNACKEAKTPEQKEAILTQVVVTELGATYRFN